MAIMQEAIDKEDWERMQKGLPPLPKKKMVYVEPEKPKVENYLTYEDIPLDRFERLLSAKKRLVENKDGVMFIGMDVLIELRGKRKPGRPPLNEEEQEPKLEIISGWMDEGNWHKLYLQIRDRVDITRIVW